MFLYNTISQLRVLMCPHKAAPCAAEGHTVIEPVPETVEAILDEVFGCSEVEPGID